MAKSITKKSNASREQASLRVLAIESSCDETGVALIEDGRVIRANVVASQASIHAQYGGVVPEVASRHQLSSTRPTQSLCSAPFNTVSRLGSDSDS